MAPAGPRKALRGSGLGSAAALGPALCLVLVFQFVPMITLFRYSLNEYSPSTLMVEAVVLDNYLRFFSDTYFRNVLFTTVWISLATTATSVVLGFPVAYFLARLKSRYKSLVIILILFPLLVGNVVRAAGWMAAFGRSGMINYYLMELGLTSQPVEFLNSWFAVYVGLLGVMLPFMILALQSVLEGLDFTLVDAAKSLGARPFTSFLKIVLPLSLSGVAAGSVLVFMLAMNSYATPVLLGGSGFRMMAPVLYSQISVASNWPFGAALAFILIAVTFLITTIITIALMRRARQQSSAR